MSDLTNLAEIHLSKKQIAERALARNTRARFIAQQEIQERIDNIGEMSNAEKINLIFSDKQLSTVERVIETMKLRSEGQTVLIEHLGANQWKRTA